MDQLSANARRVLNTLNEIACGRQFAATRWIDLISKTGLSRGSVASAIRELKAAQVIERESGWGTTARYHILRAVGDSPGETVCTGSNQFKLVQTSTPDDYLNLNSDDDEARLQKRERLKALLGEFLIEEPARSKLAELLIPLGDREQEIRAICERTLKETVWKRPRGVMIRRLEALAAGRQDPLPVFADVMKQPAEARPGAARPARKSSRRRAQVGEPSEAELEAARARARTYIEQMERQRKLNHE